MRKYMGQESLEALWADVDQMVHEELVGVYDYQGSVATYQDLPTLSAGDNGMVYNVIAAHGDNPPGTNYAWTGTAWDALGGAENRDATPTTHGLMSSSDKSKLDGIEANANAYSLPTMSESTKGGAKVGSGLSMEGDVLSVDLSDGDGPIASLSAEGWAEQDGTPAPDDPQEIRVARGRNLLDPAKTTDHSDGTIIYGYTNDGGFPKVTGAFEAGTYTLTISAKQKVTPSGQTPKWGSVGVWVRATSDGTICKFNRTTGDRENTDNGGVPVFANAGLYNTAIPVDYETRSCTFPIGFDFTELILGFYHSHASLDYEYIQLELGSTPTPYVPYGHVGLEVQGRNLFGGLALARAIKAGAPSATIDEDAGTITYQADEAGGDVWFDGFEEGKLYTVILCVQSGYNNYRYFNRAGQSRYFTPTVMPDGNNVARVATSDISALAGENYGGTTTLKYNLCGIFEGDVSWDDYEPYRHTVTPVPLPVKGWAGALPDGTADRLTVDSAGKWTWEGETALTTQAVTDGVTGIVGDDVLSETGEIADGVTVLYTLATPTTEELGYIDMPEVSEGDTVTIPELEGLAVVRLADGSANALVRQWAERLEYEIGSAVTELAARVSALENA